MRKEKKVLIFHYKNINFNSDERESLFKELTSWFKDTNTKPLIIFSDGVEIHSSVDNVIEDIKISDIQDYLLQKKLKKLIA